MKSLLVLAIEFRGGFGSGDSLAHHEHLDDAPCDDVVDEHSEDGSPLKDAALCLGDSEHGDEWRSEGRSHHVDEIGKTGAGIGTEELEDETESEENLDETEDIPDDLRTAIEGLRAAG